MILLSTEPITGYTQDRRPQTEDCKLKTQLKPYTVSNYSTPPLPSIPLVVSL